MTPPVLAIVGPTASGKTEAALRVAREQNGEIISVDSRQVYRGLPIGTAQPTGKWSTISPSPRRIVSRGPMDPPLTTAGDDVKELLVVEGIPYHLIGFLDPRERFCAADFAARATALIKEIRERGKTPILAGGTGFYFKALEGGLAPLPPADADMRARLLEEAQVNGRPALHARLARVDPEAAAKIPANNIQRVIRALEVHELTGKPISQWHREHQNPPSPQPSPTQRAGEGDDALASSGEGRLSLHYIGIDPGPEELDRRITRRAETMLAAGMIEETRAALEDGIPETADGLTGLGYPRVIAFLKNEIARAELLRLLILDTRQYAKRQRTWFRHQATVLWKTS